MISFQLPVAWGVWGFGVVISEAAADWVAVLGEVEFAAADAGVGWVALLGLTL